MAILTISRQYGSGGREISQGVAGAMGYVRLDKGRLLQEMGASGKKWQDWGRGFDEHSPSVWERYDWSFLGFGALIKSILLEFAAQDNVVLMGRGANFLLKDVPHAFRIRVVAPVENRIERIMVREFLDYDTARWLAERTDLERAQFIMALYGREWDDPEAFDAVLDTGGIPVGEVIATACKELTARDALKTHEAQEALKLHAVGAKVEAGLLTQAHLFVNTLEVSVMGDGLLVRGVVHSPKQKHKVEEIATTLAGTTHVSFQLHYRME
jgi:cytidylate kinase